MAIWSIDDGGIVWRRARPIAQAVKVGDKWGWKWLGDQSCYRQGFTTRDEVLPDVKYYHRYNPPQLAVTFKSGRRVVIPGGRP